jgi:hypothetical protein
MYTQQCRSLCLLLAAVVFLGSRGAQPTAAGQGFKTIPQQIKSNAEVKATESLPGAPKIGFVLPRFRRRDGRTVNTNS